jgi:hypothetical protein
MTKAIFAGKKIEKFSLKRVLAVLEQFTQYSRGSLKISSCVIVQATHAIGIDNIINQII